MPQMIFVNLPVADLERSKAFFAGLGFGFSRRLGDTTTACMVVSDTIFVMLLTHARYRRFAGKEIADATKVSETMICLSRDSCAEVDAMMEAALKGGATESRAAEDLGFMYHRAFDDPDGHTWEVMWLDPAAMQPA